MGDGYMLPFCRLLRERSPVRERIRLSGAVSHERALAEMRAADLFTLHNQRGPLTNQEEAFGVSLLEAMAAGLPVVTGRNGGVEEIVLDGETGLLFEPGDIDAHATALLRLCRNGQERHAMGAAGRERVASCFPASNDAAGFRATIGLGGGRRAPGEHGLR